LVEDLILLLFLKSIALFLSYFGSKKENPHLFSKEQKEKIEKNKIKPGKVIPVKQRETKLDRLEKLEGITKHSMNRKNIKIWVRNRTM